MINGVSRRKRKPFKSTHRLENYLEWWLSSSIQNKRHFRERLHISSVRPSKWLRSDANCVYASSWRWYSKSLKSMSFTRLQQKTKVTVVSIPNNERQPLPLCLLEMESLHLSSYQDFRWLYMFHLGEMVCLLNKFIRCTGWWRNVYEVLGLCESWWFSSLKDFAKFLQNQRASIARSVAKCNFWSIRKMNARHRVGASRV